MVESEGQVIHHADTLDYNFVLRYANRHLNKPMHFSFAYIFISGQIVSKPLLFIWESYVCMRQGGWIWVLGIS